MKTLTIDRLEGDIAVCEQADRTMVNIPLSQLPEGVGEGDVLVAATAEAGADIAYTIDKEATDTRRAAAKALLERLKNRKQ